MATGTTKGHANGMMKCRFCGNEIAVSAKICPYCGAKLKKGNPIGIVLIVLFVILGIGTVRTMPSLQNSDQSPKQEEQISTVLDCSKFSRISSDELKGELGEPKRTENWNNQTSKGDFPMQILTYDFEGFYGEFILYDNTVVKLRLFSESQWQVEGSNADNIFAMFGITPGENAKQTVNTGITHKFSPVSDKVAEVEFYNYDDENKSFDTVYVTYNLNYFD